MAKPSPGKKQKLSVYITIDELKEIGAKLMNRSTDGSKLAFERRWKNFFNTDLKTCFDLWVLLLHDVTTDPKLNGAAPEHMLWALMFLALNGEESQMTGHAGCDEKTWRKWTKLFIERIAGLADEVVSEKLWCLYALQVKLVTLIALFHCRFFGRIESKVTKEMIVWCQLTALIAKLLCKRPIYLLSIHTSFLGLG